MIMGNNTIIDLLNYFPEPQPSPDNPLPGTSKSLADRVLELSRKCDDLQDVVACLLQQKLLYVKAIDRILTECVFDHPAHTIILMTQKQVNIIQEKYNDNNNDSE